MTGKIKVHIDPKGYDEKPSGKEIGGIKSRLQKDTSPSLVTLEELVQKVETGHSISPGIMEGMSAKDWKEQQLFMVDIDNEEYRLNYTVLHGQIAESQKLPPNCSGHALEPA